MMNRRIEETIKRVRVIDLGIYHCIQCGHMLIDPDLYYRADENFSKKATLNTEIKCPYCGKVQTLREMGDKELMETPDENLTSKGIRRKRTLMRKPYPQSLSDIAKACKEPAQHKMRRWKMTTRKVTWLLKKDRFCRKCGATFPKGSSVGKFLRHVQDCGKAR